MGLILFYLHPEVNKKTTFKKILYLNSIWLKKEEVSWEIARNVIAEKSAQASLSF